MLSDIPTLLDDISAGRMVILMDDEDRENEGDLIIAAEKITPAVVNFFATEACGLICMPITPERARQLNLPLMVRDNRSQHETNFTVSIDATSQVGPGISAAQRAHTILQAVAEDATPKDIQQPGHIFPLVAKPGGVLKRAGHTEAGVDLARMAGLAPAAVIVEIMNPDGTMARRPELEVFAKQHQLNMGTIADLIEYRSLHEQSIELHCAEPIHTEWGRFVLHTYRDLIDGTLALCAESWRPVRTRPHARSGPADEHTSGFNGHPLGCRQCARLVLPRRNEPRGDRRVAGSSYCWVGPRPPTRFSKTSTSCCMQSSDPHHPKITGSSAPARKCSAILA
jgi:3,4-dihydroxy-2-butanone 4-phosphate synthase